MRGLGTAAAEVQQRRLVLAEHRVRLARATVDAALHTTRDAATRDALLDVRLALTAPDPAGPAGTPERTPHA